MNKVRNLNPQIVHDAAAHLFWTMAESVGINEATEAVIDSSGRCLVEQVFTGVVLSQYGFEKLPLSDQREFGNAIAAEAERFAIKGENMDGVIYAEDAQGGRSPSAQHVLTTHLGAIPKRVVASGAKIEKIGRLCIRHPLPAVVFSDTRPLGSVIEVADTSTALGFNLPMFLSDVTTTQLDDELFVSAGVFHIPVPDTRAGNEWGAVIQNSTRFISGIQFHVENGNSTVDVEWQS